MSNMLFIKFYRVYLFQPEVPNLVYHVSNNFLIIKLYFILGNIFTLEHIYKNNITYFHIKK